MVTTWQQVKCVGFRNNRKYKRLQEIDRTSGHHSRRPHISVVLTRGHYNCSVVINICWRGSPCSGVIDKMVLVASGLSRKTDSSNSGTGPVSVIAVDPVVIAARSTKDPTA